MIFPAEPLPLESMLCGRPGSRTITWKQRRRARIRILLLSRIFKRKYTPFLHNPVKNPKGSYGGRLGHVPGVYARWKEAQMQTLGNESNFK